MPNLALPGCRASRLLDAILLTAARAAISASLALALFVAGSSTALAEIPPIKRVLPPEGIEIPADVRERLETRLAGVKKRLAAAPHQEYSADVEIFTKAVDFALLHREFYVPRDFAKADWALDQAEERLAFLEKGEFPWKNATGLVVRGYRSYIDGSAQPYGLVTDAGHDFDKPYPLYVWLHGRGDKQTDLHFLYERATKTGQIAPPGAMVLHPFGRHCVGFKHAGEMDVIEAVNNINVSYYMAREPVLIGFSMGGAGAWHLGAHYDYKWKAVAPGAGFAETARYQKLSPDRYPPWYEQTLWGQYDVPNYVRNLFNTEVIAYSGELDKQIQAARVMEEAYQVEGRTLTHLIGPGVEHKYEPETLKSLLSRLAEIEAAPPPPGSNHDFRIQTRTLRYPGAYWAEPLKLEEHWKDARVDAQKISPQEYRITTKNVAILRATPFLGRLPGASIFVDDVRFDVNDRERLHVVKKDGTWVRTTGVVDVSVRSLMKRHRITGPIDDVFTRRFIVVLPTGKSKNPKFQEWVEFESAHFINRWRALMRGEPEVVRDVDLPEDEIRFATCLVLWGDPDSNVVMRKLLARTPAKFEEGTWTFGARKFDGNRFVPSLIYPYANHEGTYDRYLVLNSGLTFREGHDHTNSLQNPKLPDWAIIDMTKPPDAFAPGRIHDAGFFDENWQLKGPPKGPGGK